MNDTISSAIGQEERQMIEATRNGRGDGRVLPRMICAALLVLASSSWAREANAATQTYTGEPIMMQIQDSGRPRVEVRPPGGGAYVYQYYNGVNFGNVVWLKIGTTWTAYSSGYVSASGTTTPVSNVYSEIPGGGGKIETVVALGSTGVQLKQTFSHRTGDRFITKEWELTNTGSTVIDAARFYHGGDTWPHGIDRGYGGYDADRQMVYTWNNQTGWVGGVMGYYADPSTPASRYFEGTYSTGNSHAQNRTDLPNTVVQTSEKDTGYYLQWDRSGLGQGESWTIKAVEVWTGALKVIPPADQTYPAGGETIKTFTFKVQNTDANPMNVELSAGNDRNWTTTIAGAGSVTVPANGSIDVAVDVTVPAGANVTAAVTLAADGGSAVLLGSGSARLVPVVFSVQPTFIDFGDHFLETRSRGETITVTNSTGVPLDLAVGWSDPAFVIVGDDCSGRSVPVGGTCEIVVAYQAPDFATSNDDSIWISVSSPIVHSAYVALHGRSFDCMMGEHWDGTRCVFDDPNSHSCASGFHWNGVACAANGTDPESCVDGSYHWDGTECVPNDANPHLCADGYHWNGVGCAADELDPKSCVDSSYHWDGEECVPSDPNPHSCSGGFHWNGVECVTDGTDSKSCVDDSHHWDGEKCVPNGPNSHSCAGGYHWDGVECISDGTEPKSCADSSYHWDGEECVPSDPNPYSCSGGFHWNGVECVTDGPGSKSCVDDSHHWDGEKCVPNGPNSHSCADGYHWNGVECISDGTEPKSCVDDNHHWDGEECLPNDPNPHSCADGFHWDGAGCVSDDPDPKSCVDNSYHWNGEECVSNDLNPHSCVGGYHWDGMECVSDDPDPKSCADSSYHWNGEECVSNDPNPHSCADGYHWDGMECVSDDPDPKSCVDSGYHWNGVECVPNDSGSHSCADGYHWNGEECIADLDGSHPCLPGYRWDGEKCVSRPRVCAPGYHWDGVECVSDDPDPESCADGYYWNGEECVELETAPPLCLANYHWNGERCVSNEPDPHACARGYYWKDGEGCVPPEVPMILEPADGDVAEDGVLISGTATPGMTVVVMVDGEVACTAVADATGRWSCSVSGLGDGDHMVVATVTEAEGKALSSDPVHFSVEIAGTVDAEPELLFHGGGIGCSASGGGTASVAFPWLIALFAVGTVRRQSKQP